MKLLIICGPTATGKTALAIKFARIFDGELINADSRQVYHDLDALTGKDRSQDIPIHLYDIVSPDQEFSAMHFARLAQTAIDDVHKRTKLPIVVGGTGFYLRALTTSIDTLGVAPNSGLRKTLSSMPVEKLQQRLQNVDQDRWEQMNDSDRKNPRRLIRAIEVAAIHKAVVEQRQSLLQGLSLNNNTLWVGLTTKQEVLKERIATRVAQRFEEALTEVREGLPPILGVTPLLSYKRGEITKEDALHRWTQLEYRYAKRQITWFKKQQDIHWFDVTIPSYAQKVETLVRSWYTSKCDDIED